MADWYRKKSWTQTDEEEFFLKLGRARKNGRAQYLRVQAVELLQTGEQNLLKVVEFLLNKILEDYPENQFEKSITLNTLGDVYQALDDNKNAIIFYKQALEFEEIYPQSRTQAYLNYSEAVLKMSRTDLYDEVEKVLLNRYDDLLFPVEKYKVNSILSIINKHRDNIEMAKYYAEIAEQNANAKTSGLRYHKYLGVVTERKEWLDNLVKQA